jgi:phospholipid N-methyltransferase
MEDFIEQCRRNFLHTGAVVPSPRALARAMTSHISPGGAPRRVLEAGPGTGVFTLEIARNMGPFDHLDVYEINPVFANYLEERFRTDPEFTGLGRRLVLHRTDVLALPPDAVYDGIVSSLPLTNFEPACVRKLLEAFMTHLAPGGMLSYFEYALVRQLKRYVSSRAERTRLKAVEEVTSEYIHRFQVRSEPVLLNLPPAVARHLVKPATLTRPVAARPQTLQPAAVVQ